MEIRIKNGMEQRIKRGIAGLVVVSAIIGAWVLCNQGREQNITSGGVPASAPPLSRITYTADVSINPEKHEVRGKLAVHLNDGQQEPVYFHLYPNVFRDTALLQNENWLHMLGKNQEPGEMIIEQVKTGGKSIPVTFQNNDSTILQVSPPHSSPSEKLTDIEIGFSLKIPHNNGRMSYNDHAIWLGNWLPILAMKDSEGWRLDPYYPIGDPFYSDIANYEANITIPEGYQLASTGAETTAMITQTRPARQKRYQVQVNNVRDFALVVMDDSYLNSDTTVGSTLVRTWSQEGDDPDWVNQLHETAVEALRYYCMEFGSYPYSEYDVVKTGGFFGGMEYPGIVFIQGDLFNDQSPTALITVAHETAHQWFYGLVGNDEVREAWVDEALTDYAALSFLHRYNPRIARGYLAYRMQHAHNASLYGGKGITAWQPINRFPDWQSYSDLVYSRGAMMLWELREAWGEEYVNDALHRYVMENQYKQTGGKEVIAAFNQVAGSDGTAFFDYWMRLDQSKKQAADEWIISSKEKFAQ